MRKTWFLFLAVILLALFKVSLGWAEDLTPVSTPSESTAAPTALATTVPTPSTSSTPMPTTIPSPSSMPFSTPTPYSSGIFGVRETGRLAFFNLSDLNSTQAWRAYHYQQLPSADGYQTVSNSLSSCAVFEVNPYIILNPDLEVGLALNYWAFTPLIFDETASLYTGYFADFQHNLNSFELDAKVRFYFINVPKNGIRLFLEPSAGIQPIQLQLVNPYEDTTDNPSSNVKGETVSATAFDASLLAGMTISLGTQISFSLDGGFQYAYATNFNGTYSDVGVPAMNGVAGMDRFYNIPNDGPGQILFTPNDPSRYGKFGLTATEVGASRPMVIDLSGFRFSADINFNF